MDGAKTKVMLAEDHQVVREGLRALLAGQADLEVIAEASDGLEAVRLAEELAPDVVVMDIGLPGQNGIEATRRLKKSRPETAVIVLSMHDDGPTVDQALRAGARGYVLKGRGVNALCDAIRTARRGEVYLSPEISTQLLEGYLRGGKAGDDDKEPLSPREREILQLVAEGHTGRVIAEKLGLKPKTVENHRANIMDKLGIHTTAGLVRYALRTGLAR